MIKTLLHRIKSDYFLSNRIAVYKKILQKAHDSGYQFISHSKFYELAKENKLGEKKYFLIRHDIDSDPKYCDFWLNAEKQYDIFSSYYFRQCTIDIAMMNKINAYGSDAGYHYEELSDYAKENRILDVDVLKNHFPQIREKFINNFKDLEKRSGFKIKSIASHGDFANNKLNIKNYAFINKDLMEELKIDFETYQSEFLDNYSINISDCTYPKFFKGDMDPFQAIEQNLKVIHLLIHPRHWRTHWSYNTFENWKRLIEGIRFH